MTPSDIQASPLQLKLKDFCIWIETKFEARIGRAAFALRMALAAAGFAAILYIQKICRAESFRTLSILFSLLFAGIVFWVILQIVRRLHDMGRSGSLFWGIAIPFGVAWRIGEVFHLVEKASERWRAWILLAGLCAWSMWLSAQLFLKKGADGPIRFERRTDSA